MMDPEAIAAALADPKREPSGPEGVPGWRPIIDGRPHPADLQDIVAAARRVCVPGDDQQVEIARRGHLAAGAGAEQDDLVRLEAFDDQVHRGVKALGAVIRSWYA